MRAIEISRVLHEAVVSGNHARVEAVLVSGRTQGLTLVPVRVAPIQDRAERLIAADATDDQIRTAVDAVDVVSPGSM